MLDKKDLFSIRGSVDADRNFILATWLRGLKYGNDWFHAIDSEAYYKHYQAVLQALLDRPTTEVKVACLKDDPDVILGYLVHKGPRIDWVFIKSAWRGIGIARSLIPPGAHTVTHLTKVGMIILKKHPELALTFNPFALN